MFIALIMVYIKLLGSHINHAIEDLTWGFVDFMNSNPHGGHALNEVWLVALVVARTPNVKLATMKYRVWFV